MTSGFKLVTFAAIVDGIVESVGHAHHDMAPAKIILSHGELHKTRINGFPASFNRTPASNRAVFPNRIDPHSTLVWYRS
ncbi:neutral/alkaline non-lysosomal ceramidase N-terminal domain-containing protein [Mycobacterium uberis]|uniref:neutral/alkaline non-lysosomal ceramidase N-terminal domain-containing protein n=1 Tax=Mycobacterium uberis TaxID=2162698 RepID=UPI001FB47493|nr:neutral/alkaline non-lysosomal ceramidase N-terminal domain-containing protein [Mycobacterium uberis]